MKLKYFVSALVIAAAVVGAWAAKDPVLMTINNKKVTLSEFEYLYKKNLDQQVNKESIDEYVERFVSYKLKVAEAEALGYDTLPRIVNELNGYKSEILTPFLTDNDLKEKLIQEAYNRMTMTIDVNHLMLPRGASDEENRAQLAKMDSIRNCILNGESFTDMVMKYSVDPSRRVNQGHYEHLSSGFFPYSIEYVAFNTPVGEISQPFLSEYGVHLIKVNGVQPSEGQVEVGHILRRFPRDVNDSIKAVIKAQADSIYQCLLNGENFEEMARNYCQDGSAQYGGKLPMLSRGGTIQAFDDVAFALADGEISQPFETIYGYHIVKKYSHKPVGTLEECRPNIEAMMQRDERASMPVESRVSQIMSDLNYKKNDKLHEYLMKELNKHGGYDSTFVTDVVAKSKFVIFTYGKDKKTYLSAMTKMLNPKAQYASNEVAAAAIEGNVERIAKQEVVQYYSENLFDINPDYRNLMNEYRDGTLLFEVMNNEVWRKAKTDEAGLQQLFDENRDKYRWDSPHFKGIMVCAKNDSILNEVGLAMQQMGPVPEDTITTTLNKKFGHNIKMVRVISKKGENEMVDYIAFDGPKAASSYSGFPVYTKLLGRIIDQPEELSDVKGLVSSDYQDILEQQWLEGLRKKYKVTIDQKVLNQLKARYQ